VRPAASLKPLAVARHRNVLQTKVNSNRRPRRGYLLTGDLHRYAQPPIPAGILRKAAVPPLHPFEALALKDAKRFAGETQSHAFAFQVHSLERNPTQGAASTARNAPAQLHTLGGSSFGRVLRADSLNRVRADALEKFSGSGGETAEIKAGKELRVRAAIAIRCINARGIRPIEDLIYFNSCGVEPRIRFALHL
jgi:hypothetical protein